MPKFCNLVNIEWNASSLNVIRLNYKKYIYIYICMRIKSPYNYNTKRCSYNHDLFKFCRDVSSTIHPLFILLFISDIYWYINKLRYRVNKLLNPCKFFLHWQDSALGSEWEELGLLPFLLWWWLHMHLHISTLLSILVHPIYPLNKIIRYSRLLKYVRDHRSYINIYIYIKSSKKSNAC